MTRAAFAPALDRLLYYILLAVLCARPLISESYEHNEIGFLAALPDAGGPTPATTAWLDTLLLAASVLTLARGRRWRANVLLGVGVVLLAAAVLVSSHAAADRYLALLAGSSLLIGVLAGIALGSLLQTRWMLHVLIAAALASGCTTAIKCVRQSTDEFTQTRQAWEQEYKPRLIQQGYDPDDPLIVNYERRMISREAYGFLSHPNVTGSCLMMWLLAAGGILAARCGAGAGGATRLLVATALCALLAVALWFTGSRGALIGALVGAAALAALGVTARWSARHARLVLALLFSGYALFIGAAAAYGVSRGTLPHPSLAFRWYYWTAAARAYEDAPLTGIGRDNFAAAYMRYKVPESTEEVRDPHNVWVSLLVELGPLGLIAGLVLCVACLLVALRGLGNSDDFRTATVTKREEGRDEGTKARRHEGEIQAAIVARAVPAAVGVLLVHALFSGTAFGQAGIPIVWGADVALTWIVAFAVSIWLLDGVGGAAGASKQRARWLAAGLVAALLAALVHGLIDFTLMIPGGLAVFVLCAAGAAGGEHGRSKPRPCHQTAQQHEQQSRDARSWTRVAAASVGIAVVAAHLLCVTQPARVTEAALRDIDEVMRTPPLGGPQAILRVARTAANAAGESLPVTIAAARASLQVGRLTQLNDAQRLEGLRQARDLAEDAARRNPRDTGNYALLALVEQESARVHDRLGNPDEAGRALQEATQSWDRAVELYPTNPRSRISAGGAWFEIWQRTGSPEAARRAAEHLAEAFRIDDCRPPYEVTRLRPREREPAEESLRQLDRVQ